MRLFRAMFALWPCVAMTENVCRGADPEGSFITFLSHRSGRNLLYLLREGVRTRDLGGKESTESFTDAVAAEVARRLASATDTRQIKESIADPR